jgi:glycosyltransferase involved in cell wall biosynthesis
VEGIIGLGNDHPPFEFWGDPDVLENVPPDLRVASTFNGGEWYGQREILNVPAGGRGIYLHHVRPLRGWRSATTILDTIPLRYGNPVSRRLKRRFLMEVCRRSSRLLTISEYSRDCMERDLGVDPGSVQLLPIPMDHRLASSVRTLRMNGAVPRDILFVGQVAEHKNVMTLIDAFDRASLPRGTRLRIVGASSEQARSLSVCARQRNLDIDVVNSADIDVLQLSYAQAAVLVQPSLEEGWGIPAYEAIACGIPVISNSYSALSEVGRSAVGRYDMIDARSLSELVQALERSFPCPSVREMDELSERALQDAPTARNLGTVLSAVGMSLLD